MASPFSRQLAVVLVAAAVLGLASRAALRAQDMTDETPSTGKNKLHYPISEELGGLLDGAERAAKEGQHERAVELVRHVLDQDQKPSRPDLIVPLETTGKGQDELRRFIGATERAIKVLRAFPAPAIQTFRKRYDDKARHALDAAKVSPEAVVALARTYDRWPVATCAPLVLETAGDVAAEAGDAERARRFYLRARRDLAELPAPEGDDAQKAGGAGGTESPRAAWSSQAARVRTKLVLILTGLGRVEEVEALTREMESEDKLARFSFDGAPLTKDEVARVALRQRAIRRGEAKGSRADWLQPRADSANRATVARPAKVGAARFAPRGFDRAYDSGIHVGPGDGGAPRHLPLVFGDQLFLTTADRLRARKTTDGEEPKLIAPPHSMPPYADDNPKVLFSAALDRGVIASSFLERVQEEQSYRGIPIKVRIPFRKLAGFDADRMRWKWDHHDSLEGHKLARGSFPSPPVASEGVLYAPAWTIEGYVHCYAAAFDVETGAPRWTTWLASGQVEQTMFGELAREPLSLPVAVDEGTVYDVTCFGAVVALDQETGRPRWVTEYDQIPISAAKGYYPDPRHLPWEANPPVVESGVLIVAPLDSRFYYGIDGATGQILWSYEARPSFDEDAHASGVRFVLGADQGKVVLASRTKVICRDVRSGKCVWDDALSGKYVAGRGLIAGGKVLVPLYPSDIGTLDLSTGARESTRAITLTGNLAIGGDSLVVVGDGTVAAFGCEPPEPASKQKDF